MEIVISAVEGTVPSNCTCKFCDSPATKLFGIVDIEKKRYNGYPTKLFCICDKHMQAINSLLDGSKDIDSLIKVYDRIAAGGRFNLRAHI